MREAGGNRGAVAPVWTDATDQIGFVLRCCGGSCVIGSRLPPGSCGVHTVVHFEALLCPKVTSSKRCVHSSLGDVSEGCMQWCRFALGFYQYWDQGFFFMFELKLGWLHRILR
jgi:hypothetical protein